MKLTNNQIATLKTANKSIKGLKLTYKKLEKIACNYDLLGMHAEDSPADFESFFNEVAKIIVKNAVVVEDTTATNNLTNMATIFENVRNEIFENLEEDNSKICNKLQDFCELDEIYKLDDFLNELVDFCKTNKI